MRGKELDPQLTADCRAWHANARRESPELELGSHKAFAEFHNKHYQPLLDSEVEYNSAQPEKAVIFCSQFNNRWIWLAVHAWREHPRDALEGLVEDCRQCSFGTRPAKGPDWEDIINVFSGSLGHLKLLEDITRQGGGAWVSSGPVSLVVPQNIAVT